MASSVAACAAWIERAANKVANKTRIVVGNCRRRRNTNVSERREKDSSRIKEKAQSWVVRSLVIQTNNNRDEFVCWLDTTTTRFARTVKWRQK